MVGVSGFLWLYVEIIGDRYGPALFFDFLFLLFRRTDFVMHNSSSDTLYQQLGGESALENIVPGFYSRVIMDPLLAPFFEGVDMPRLLCRWRDFFSLALGGPDRYDGATLRAAHAPLVREWGLGDIHFDAVKRHLAETLAALNLTQGQIDHTLAVVESTRKDVLCK